MCQGPPCPNTGQVLVQGAKVRKQGVAMFGHARVTARHVPRTTRWQPYPLMATKGCPTAYSPEHKSAWNYTNTLPLYGPFLQLAQSYKPYSLGLKPQKPQKYRLKKALKCGNAGSPRVDKPVFGQERGGGGGCISVCGAPSISYAPPSPVYPHSGPRGKSCRNSTPWRLDPL